MSIVRRIGGMALAATLTVGTVAVASHVPSAGTEVGATRLELSNVAEQPVCGGPAGLLAPQGGTTTDDGATTVAAVVARAGLVRSASPTASTGTAGATGTTDGTDDADDADDADDGAAATAPPVVDLSPTTSPEAQPGTGPDGATPTTADATTDATASAGATAGTGPVRLAEVDTLAPGTGTVAASVGTLSGTVTAAAGHAGVWSGTPTGAGAVRVEAGAEVGTGRSLPLVTAAQGTVATQGERRGLSLETCTAAATDVWLVGGGTSVGHRTRLLVANPTASTATVDVTVHGTDGAVRPAAATAVGVAAGTVRAFAVEALAPDQQAVAVHVTATSGRVVAVLHDDLLRGATAGGADTVVAGSGPATRQLVAGLSVSRAGQGASGGTLPAGAHDAGADAVRVAVPGAADAVVKVTLLGADGAVTWASGVTTVPGGTAVDLAVGDVPDGLYTAVVTADVPVVAGGLVGRAQPGSDLAGTATSTGSEVPPAEFAWLPAVTGLTSASVVALPQVDGAVRTLALGGTADRDRVVHVTPLGADGAPGATRAVTVAAGTTTAVDVPADAHGLLVVPAARTGDVVAGVLVTVATDDGTLVGHLAVRSGRTGVRAAPEAVQAPAAGLG